MGFKVDGNGVVHVDLMSNFFANTTVGANPTKAETHCPQSLEVYSLLLRLKNMTDKREVGDNCPLIYALKLKEGLSVTYNSVKPLIAPLNEIIDKLLGQFEEQNIRFDAVIPMPSSHKISNILAKRLSKKLNIPVDSLLFRKSNIQDIEDQLANPCFAIPHAAKVNIGRAVIKAKDNGTNFSMSDVKTKYRSHIQPLTLNQVGQVQTYHSVLLVDDLFATGSTLIQAKDALLSSQQCQQVRAVVLFSPLGGRIRR